MFVHMETMRRYGLVELIPGRLCWCVTEMARRAAWWPRSACRTSATRRSRTDAFKLKCASADAACRYRAKMSGFGDVWCYLS